MSNSKSPDLTNTFSVSFAMEDFDYQLLDAGNFKKLERFGDQVFIRPAPQALWPKRLANKEWKRAVGEYQYTKNKEYGGNWTYFSEYPEDGWSLRFRELVFWIQPTGFGHIGLFPEQAPQWDWLIDRTRNFSDNGINILNIFGYTGASTIAAAFAGAKVTHVDASKASVTWARKNQEMSGLADRPVRWIVDDVLKFLKREHRRGNRYDGIILDPPTFGRGPKGEVWKIEKNLSPLMELCQKVLSDKPKFLLFTTHSPGFSSLTLENMLRTHVVPKKEGTFESGEMFIYDHASGLNLPNGFYSRWTV